MYSRHPAPRRSKTQVDEYVRNRKLQAKLVVPITISSVVALVLLGVMDTLQSTGKLLLLGTLGAICILPPIFRFIRSKRASRKLEEEWFEGEIEKLK